MTCITHKAIRSNGLISYGKRPVMTGTGLNHHRRYAFHMSLNCESVDPFGNGSPTIYVLPEPQDAVDLADNYNFDVIIGMNILKHCDMMFRKDGTFTIEFDESAFSA